MPIDFPNNPTLNEEFTSAGKTWKWNGYAWDAITLTPVGATGATGATGIGATGATGVLPPTNFGDVWSYVGDGLETIFEITGGLSILAPAYLVTIDGVVQKTTNYTINNVIPRTLTFSQSIPSGSEINIISLSVA
jgi:hypothetical protein